MWYTPEILWIYTVILIFVHRCRGTLEYQIRSAKRECWRTMGTSTYATTTALHVDHDHHHKLTLATTKAFCPHSDTRHENIPTSFSASYPYDTRPTGTEVVVQHVFLLTIVLPTKKLYFPLKKTWCVSGFMLFVYPMILLLPQVLSR